LFPRERPVPLARARGESPTVPHDLFKIKSAANFLFEVQLFLGEFVFQRIDLFEGQRVFDGDRDLRGDLLDQLNILITENIQAAAREIQRAEGAAAVLSGMQQITCRPSARRRRTTSLGIGRGRNRAK